MVADPKALQYILHTSGYNFPKSPDASHIIRMLTGDGIGCTQGKYVTDLIAPVSDTCHSQERSIGVRGKLWLQRFLYPI
jgi:hypothetical protein